MKTTPEDKREEVELLYEQKQFLEEKIEVQQSRISELERAAEYVAKLETLIEINTYITNSLEKEEVLQRIFSQIRLLLGCELSSIQLVDHELGVLKFSLLSNEEHAHLLKDASLRMGEGIAGTVWQNGIPIIMNDVPNDPRFSNTADRMANSATRSLIAVPLTVDGKIIGVIEAMNKIQGDFTLFDQQMLQHISTQSAIAIKNADLYSMAIRDGMTRLYIQKYFRERLIQEWSRSRRKDTPLSLVMLDIDFFKKFNDNYGHQAGDRVLIEVARLIAAQSRAIDIPCRYGGEEFTIILPETSREAAVRYSERVREAVEALRVESGDDILSVTVSCGVVSIPESKPQNTEELIEMADAAMYYSKSQGRNRTSYFDRELMEPAAGE
jgi:diguanylate cyclase (GGDEF)-like protein